MYILLNKCQKINMKIIVTEDQYKKVVFKLLDNFYGPNISYKKKDSIIHITSNDGEDIFIVYTKAGRMPGCKKDMYVSTDILDEIESFISKAITRKKMFSRTILSYANEKTKLDIDCVEFFYEKKSDLIGNPVLVKYNFNVKKNKRIKW